MNKIRQQSLTALYPTALIAMVGIFLTMFYWSFNIYIGGATAFLFFVSLGMFFSPLPHWSCSMPHGKINKDTGSSM